MPNKRYPLYRNTKKVKFVKISLVVLWCFSLLPAMALTYTKNAALFPADCPTAKISGPSSLCSGTDLKLFADTIEGAQYFWSGPGGFSSMQQNPVRSSITTGQAGNYFLTVSNIPGGCPNSTDNITIAVNVTPQPPSSLSHIPTLICKGSGNVKLNATGGSGEILKWFRNSCGDTLEGIGGSITILPPMANVDYYAYWESKSCGVSECKMITLTVANAPSKASAGIDIAKCGALSIALQGNNPESGTGTWTLASGPGTASFSDVHSNAATVSVSKSGDYTLLWRISTGGLCPDTQDDVVVSLVDKIPVALGSDSPLCNGADLHLTSSIPGATYTWTGPGGFSSTMQNPVITNTSLSQSGTYSLNVTDIPGGCPPASNSIDVAVMAPPVAAESVTAQPSSVYAGNGNINLVANGGSGGVVEWFADACGTNAIGSGDHIVIAAPVTSTTYFARLSSAACGASLCKDVTVSVLPGILPEFDPIDTLCVAVKAQELPIVSNNGLTGSWSPSEISTAQAGAFSYRFTPDAGQFGVPADVPVVVVALPEIAITEGIIPMDGQIMLDAGASGKGAANYQWEFFDQDVWLSIGSLQTITIDKLGKYRITVTDRLGCSSSKEFQVKQGGIIWEIPTAFSPNNDGLNDRFIPLNTGGEDPQNFTMTIYNRWGQLIFTTHDSKQGWDGRANGTLMPAGTYSYHVQYDSGAVLKSNMPSKFRGIFSLVR